MATNTPGVFTYAEWAMRMDTTGKVATLVNLLSQNNGILDDMLAVECTSGNAFEFTQVTKLPTPVRRAYNQGISATQGGVAKQVQTAIEYADYARIDDSLAQLGGNLAELRGQEIALHMQGLGQTVAYDLFYANRATDPTAFTGLANIYNTVTTSTSNIANNVIDCGGTGSTNASMWLVTWGPKHIHTIFPQGMAAGLQHVDNGRLPVTDASGGTYLAWQDWLTWRIGLAIHDWRFAVRACNIDVTLFGGASQADLIAILAAMVMKPPIMPAGAGPVQTSDAPQQLVLGRAAIYCNRTVYLELFNQARDKANVLLTMREWMGHQVMEYLGIPIRIVDALVNTESHVV